MKPRQLIIYFLIFIVLGGFYLFYEVYLKGKEAEFKEVQSKLYDLEFEEITAFKLKNKAGEIHLVRRGEDEWRITKPVETPALTWEARSVVDRVLEAKKERVFEAGADKMAEFGLEKPLQALTFMADSGALAPTLYVGGKNPLGDFYYARLGLSREVFTIPAHIQKTLAKSLLEFRDKNTVLYDRDKIDGLRFLIPKEGELKKDGESKWKIVKPDLGQADDAKIEKLFRIGLKGDIQKFESAETGEDRCGFDKPKIKMQVLSQGKVVAELIVGQAKMMTVDEKNPSKEEVIDGYWAKTSERPEVLLIDEDAFKALNQTPEDLKDKHILKFSRWDVRFVEINGPDSKLKARQVKGSWVIIEPKESQTQGSQIETFLIDLEGLEYVKKLDSSEETIKKYGLDQPEVEIKLLDNKKILVELTLSTRPIADNLLAIKVGADEAALVKADFLEKMPFDFKRSTSASKDESQVKKVVVK
ncbi:MAG: DUF4340 domain-containing protein [Deltaproteobacteria bacterium]|nr:DUF4340 domain-containing protein [Deltaproteobacteria bacterium]